MDPNQLIGLKSLVELGTFKKILRYRWEGEDRKLTAYTHGLAGSLVAIAKEWVRVPNDALASNPTFWSRRRAPSG